MHHFGPYDNSIIPDWRTAATAVRRPVQWRTPCAPESRARRFGEHEKETQLQTGELGLKSRSDRPAEDTCWQQLAIIGRLKGDWSCVRVMTRCATFCSY